MPAILLGGCKKSRKKSFETNVQPVKKVAIKIIKRRIINSSATINFKFVIFNKALKCTFALKYF